MGRHKVRRRRRGPVAVLGFGLAALLVAGGAAYALRGAPTPEVLARTGATTARQAAPAASHTPTASPTAPSPSPTPTTPGPAGSLTADSPAPLAAASVAPTPAPPTLSFEVVGEVAWISIGEPGKDPIVAKAFNKGEKASFDQPELNVLVGDGGAVRFIVNGVPRPPDPPGQPAQFTVRRSP